MSGDRHEVDQRRHARQVDRPVDAIQVVVGEVELPEQELRELVRTSRRHLEPHRLPEVPLRQFALERLAQVLDLLLVEPQVRVAGDAKLRVADDLAPAEELLQVRVDDARQEDELVVDAGGAAGSAMMRGSTSRRLDRGDRRFTPERVAAGELDDEVEALVGDLRKRVRGIEPDRRQQRLHLAPEVVRDPGALLGGALAVPQQPDAGLRQRGQNLLVQQPVLFGDQAARFVGDDAEQCAQPG